MPKKGRGGVLGKLADLREGLGEKEGQAETKCVHDQNRAHDMLAIAVTVYDKLCMLFQLKNKSKFTGPANCNKTIRHYAHLSLCAKSRKTNDAKSRKWPKTSI